jgi:hypothetical protein
MSNLDEVLVFVKMAQFESINRGTHLPCDFARTLRGRDLLRKPIKFDSGYRFSR